MASSSNDPTTGAPIFLDGDAPDPAVNPTEVAAFAAEVGTRLIGSTAQRTAYDYAREGLEWYDTTDDFTYVYDGSGWVEKFGATAWQEITPSGTGFTPYGTGIKFMRINRVVYFNVSATNSSWGVGDWAIAPIPVGFRPSETMTFTSSYNDVAREVQFTPAGTVVAVKAGSGGITVSGSYPVD